MGEEPLLSIVVPMYNLGAWEQDSLGSLAAQTSRTGWEAVVVDDGSWDGTGSSVDAWVRREGRFRVVHQPNRGVNPARYRGLRLARGVWAWCVDGDDVLHPQALAVVAEAARRFPGVELWIVGERVGDATGGKVAFAPFTEMPAMEQVPARQVATLAIGFVVFRRAMGLDLRPDNFMVGEDLFFAQRLLVSARGVGRSHAPLYGYQMRETSVMHTPSVRRLSQSIAFHRCFIPFLNAHRDRLNVVGLNQRITSFYFRLPQEILGYQGEPRRRLMDEWFAVARERASIRGNWRLTALSVLVAFFRGAFGARLLLFRLNARIFHFYVQYVQRRSAAARGKPENTRGVNTGGKFAFGRCLDAHLVWGAAA